MKILIFLAQCRKNSSKLETVKIASVKRSFYSFKACARYFHQIFIFSPNNSPSKTMKNAFYFI